MGPLDTAGRTIQAYHQAFKQLAGLEAALQDIDQQIAQARVSDERKAWMHKQCLMDTGVSKLELLESVGKEVQQLSEVRVSYNGAH